MDTTISLIKQVYRNNEGKYPSNLDEDFIRKYHETLLDKNECLNETKNQESKIIDKTIGKLSTKYPEYKSNDLNNEILDNLRFLFRECCLASIRENQESLKEKFSDTLNLFSELGFDNNLVNEMFVLLKKTSKDELSYRNYLYIEPYLNLLSSDKIKIFNYVEAKIDSIANIVSEKIYKKYPDILSRDPEMFDSKRDISLILKQSILCMLTDDISFFKDQSIILVNLFKDLKMPDDVVRDTMTLIKDICHKELNSYEFSILEKFLNIIQHDNLSDYRLIEDSLGKIKEHVLASSNYDNINSHNLYIQNILNSVALTTLTNNLHNFKSFIINTYSALLKDGLNDSNIENYFNNVNIAFHDNLSNDSLTSIRPVLKMMEVQRIKIVQTINDRKDKILSQTNERAYTKYPKMLKNDSIKNKELSLRDLGIILEECVLSMMSGKEEMLQRKMNHISQVFSNLNFDTGFVSDMMQMLDETLLRDLPPNVYTALQPHIKIAKDSLALDTKTSNR